MCVGCGACEDACSENAIINDDETFEINTLRCVGCGECVDVCPVQAINLDEGDYYDYLESQFEIQRFWEFSYLKWLGKPYLEGGYTVNGVDCSFLTYLIYSECGCYYPYMTTTAFFSLNHPDFYEVLSPQEGDIVIWEGHHMGIYVDNPDFPNQHLFSATESGGVRISDYNYWLQFGQPRYFRMNKSGG